MENTKVDKKEKKTWITPKLVVYGDIEKITKELPPVPSPSGPSS
jgi:hypothetical protein